MELYKQSIAAIGLSLERATPSVPADGYFYVLLGGEIKGRHRTLKQAKEQYKSLLDESGWTPPPAPERKTDQPREVVERYMDELEDYWSSAHKHSRRGGKTMYRS